LCSLIVVSHGWGSHEEAVRKENIGEIQIGVELC
jgi:hypothetical protein